MVHSTTYDDEREASRQNLDPAVSQKFLEQPQVAKIMAAIGKTPAQEQFKKLEKAIKDSGGNLEAALDKFNVGSAPTLKGKQPEVAAEKTVADKASETPTKKPSK